MVGVGNSEIVRADHESVDLYQVNLPLHQPAIARKNVGEYLDRLIRLLPPGAALEFVRELPRRVDREQLFADLEALVRLLRLTEHR